MRELVETKIGSVVIDYGDDSVSIAFEKTVEGFVRHEQSDDGTLHVFTVAVKPPVAHSEVTQNGSTFEVLDVRKSGDGYDLLNGNTGVWEKWVED